MAQESFICLGTNYGKHFGVDAMVSGGVSAEDAIGNDVALDAAATLQEGKFTDAYASLDNGGRRENRVVVDNANAGDAGRDAQHTVVADLGVVGDVHLVHEVIVVADARSIFSAVAPGDEYVFANDVVVADHHMRFLSLLKVEGLRFSADDRVLMNDIARSDGGSI